MAESGEQIRKFDGEGRESVGNGGMHAAGWYPVRVLQERNVFPFPVPKGRARVLCKRLIKLDNMIQAEPSLKFLGTPAFACFLSNTCLKTVLRGVCEPRFFIAWRVPFDNVQTATAGG